MDKGNGQKRPPLGRGLAELFGIGEVEERGGLFEEAKKLEQEGRFIEAFHYYLLSSKREDPRTAAKALNNASLILYEHYGERGREFALRYLEEALSLDPQNQLIRENWNALRGEGEA
uniref:Tetratricopeptide repeat protein n=1 Tax=Candidatus Caldatribacterium saccharofermentans TaxID=1454753 RepID=A0A7V4WL79_9BACT